MGRFGKIKSGATLSMREDEIDYVMEHDPDRFRLLDIIEPPGRYLLPVGVANGCDLRIIEWNLSIRLRASTNAGTPASIAAMMMVSALLR